MTLTPKQLRNFWRKVDKSAANGCWVWSGSRDGGGYGMVRIGGRLLKTHRLVLQLRGLVIPDGMVVDHRCHNTSCLNPDHLSVVTQRQNVQNKKARGSGRYTSKYPGVSWFPRDQNWVVKAWTGNKYRHIGYFETEAAAFEAYRWAVGGDIHGQFK